MVVEDDMLGRITKEFRKRKKKNQIIVEEVNAKKRGFMIPVEVTDSAVNVAFCIEQPHQNVLSDESSSEKSDDKDKKDEIDLTELISIPINSKFIMGWNIFISVLCIISSYWYGWIAAFSKHYPGINGLGIFFETCFFVNIIVNFLKEFIPEGDI